MKNKVCLGFLNKEESFKIRSHNNSKKLNKAIFNFLTSILKEVGTIDKMNSNWDLQFYVLRETGNNSQNSNESYLVTPEIANAFQKLRNELEPGLQDLFELGKEEGKKVLISLNNGDITMDDFYNKKKR